MHCAEKCDVSESRVQAHGVLIHRTGHRKWLVLGYAAGARSQEVAGARVCRVCVFGLVYQYDVLSCYSVSEFGSNCCVCELSQLACRVWQKFLMNSMKRSLVSVVGDVGCHPKLMRRESKRSVEDSAEGTCAFYVRRRL